MLRIESRNLHTWKSLFRTTRGSLSVLVVAGLALVLPGQTGDELAALADIKVGPIPGLFVLQFALGSLAVSAWYWARAALSARFGVDDALEARGGMHQTNQRAFNAVPRVLFVAGVALSVSLVWRGFTWSHALAVAAWAIPAYLLIRWRLAVTVPYNRSASVNLTVLRSRRHFRPWLRTVLPRLHAVLLLAPFGPWISGPLLGLGLAAFLFGAVEGFVPWGDGYPGLPALAARVFPGPSVALVGFALMIGPLTALVFVVDGLRLETVFLGRRIGLTRPPVIMGMLVWSLLAPQIFSLHSVRVLDPARQTLSPDARKPLQDFFASWAAACGPNPALPLRPIVVAISGGASRAGIWGAQVLAAVDAAAGHNDAAVFAISSVSGGSLGAAAYMATVRASRSGANARCQQPAGATSPVRDMLLRLNNVGLGGDALGPLLAGTLLSDTPRVLFSPAAALVRLISGIQPHGGDRAEALERAFESLWHEDLRQVGLLESGMPEFSDGFLSLSYDHGMLRPGMPIWIVNGTDLTTGGRMLTEPFGSGPGSTWPFQASGDVLGVLAADVPISTAINNGARFPYLEPSGELISAKDPPSQLRQGRPELLDGGYFDNEGLQTAFELAEWLRRQKWQGRPVLPIIVQASANADIAAAVRESIVRCPNSPLDVPTRLPASPNVLQLLAPAVGLYNTRAAHTSVLLRQVRDAYCGVGDDARSFYHFYLFNSPDRDIPLNWLLSPVIVDAIRSQLSSGNMDGEPNSDRNGNDTEYRGLVGVLQASSTSAYNRH